MNRARLALTLALVFSSLSAVSPQTAFAQTASAQGSASVAAPALDVPAALQRAFSAQTVKLEWFSPAFTAVLPQLQAGVAGFRASYGALLRVEGSAGTYRLVYGRGVVTVRASVDGSGVFTGLLLLGAVASQSDPARVSALQRLFSAPVPSPEWFTPEFLAQVPLAQLRALLAQTTDGLGAFRQVAFDGGYVLEFERGRVPVRSLDLDASGRVSGLLVGTPQSSVKYASLGEVVTALKALPGHTSLLVTRLTQAGPVDVAALDPDFPLAVGSAFKLAILAELQAQVRAGKLSWNARATLTAPDKSLPSGTLQNEPLGSTYTLQTLAEAMISVSDNTATDLLLRTVGRSGVEARLSEGPVPNPVLSTRELFALKNPANAALLARYRVSSGEARRAVIAEAARAPLPTSGELTLALDAEWHVPVRRLCTLMNEVAALPLTTLNPGVADPGSFARVSFKGGSDDGVLNMTTQVVTRGGETYCLSVGWNDARPVSASTFAALVQAALELLR